MRRVGHDTIRGGDGRGDGNRGDSREVDGEVDVEMDGGDDDAPSRWRNALVGSSLVPLIIASLVGILWIDLQTEVGVAVGCLYVVPVLLCFGTGRARDVAVTTGVALASIVAGGLLSPGPTDPFLGQTNRAIAIVAVLATAWVALRVLRLRDARNAVEMHMQAIVESLTDAIIAIDARGRVLEWSARAEDILGWTRREAMGRSLADLIVPEELRERHVAGLARIVVGGSSRLLGERLQLESLRKNGERFPIELTISWDPAGAAPRFVACLRDVTRERAARETLQRTSDDLRRSNEDLDQFAYAASHDLKTPLRAIASLAEWIDEDASDMLPADSRKDLAALRARVTRLIGLLDALLDYSRAGRGASLAETIDLNELVRDVVELSVPEQGFEVVAADLPSIHGHRAPLLQVLSNLVSNAVRHHDHGVGRIEITGSIEGGRVAISVKDDGPGIDPVFHDRIFRLFESLRPRAEVEGSGVGLALARKHVERNGGRIELESAAGAGAEFRFTWPCAVSTDPVEAEKSWIPRGEGGRLA